MPASTRTLLAAGAATVLLLAGCGGDVAGTASPASGEASSFPSSFPSSSSSSSSSSAPAPSSAPSGADQDLAAGLLPAASFAPGGQVVPVTQEQLEQGAAANEQASAGSVVTPEACAAAVTSTQVDVADFEAVAAQAASSGTAATVELLLSGGPVAGSVDRLRTTVTACPSATVSSPQIGQATVDFTLVEAAPLGDASVVVSYTTGVAGTSVPTLLGLVEDGERLLTMVLTDAGGGAVDPAAFVALVQQAFQYQADQLD